MATLVEVAPQRWSVREKLPPGSRSLTKVKLLGTIEYHEFWTYKGKRRVKDGFWIARFPDNGWKESGWKKVESKDAAIAMLKKGSGHKHGPGSRLS